MVEFYEYRFSLLIIKIQENKYTMRFSFYEHANKMCSHFFKLSIDTVINLNLCEINKSTTLFGF